MTLFSVSPILASIVFLMVAVTFIIALFIKARFAPRPSAREVKALNDIKRMTEDLFNTLNPPPLRTTTPLDTPNTHTGPLLSTHRDYQLLVEAREPPESALGSPGPSLMLT